MLPRELVARVAPAPIAIVTGAAGFPNSTSVPEAIDVNLSTTAETQVGGTLAVSETGAGRPREWVHHLIDLLDAAISQLPYHEQAAHCALHKAASLLRRDIDPQPAAAIQDKRGRLATWQARKVREYIDGHVTGRVLVTDLCALVRLSQSHFSRSFKRTFGMSPHEFVIRRRLGLATQYMLQTDASLSDIAIRCGFSDQAHMNRRFRLATGETPARWRRARWIQDSHRPQLMGLRSEQT